MTPPKKSTETPKAPTSATIFVALEYPEWQKVILTYMAARFDAEKSLPDNRGMFQDLKVCVWKKDSFAMPLF